MNRRAARLALAALGLFLAAPVRAGTGLACYYGFGRLDELASYDVVILQPGHYAAADVAKLKAAGVSLVLGYVTLGEDDGLRRGDGRGPGGQASWYLDEFTGDGFGAIGADGKPDRNAEWGSYYVDPGNRAWRRRIRDEVRRIRALGMDGVFADTVLLPTDVYRDRTETRLQAGMDRLVRSLKGWADGGQVFVNNGADAVGRWRKRVDGVVLEDTVTEAPDFWPEIRRQSLAVAATKPPVRASGLFYVPEKAALAPACARLNALGLPASLYVADEDGLALKKLPDAVCPGVPAR